MVRVLAVSDEVDEGLCAGVGAAGGDDPVHQGFTALNRLAVRLEPALLLHGHVAPGDVAPGPGRRLGRTAVCNVAGRHLIEIEPGVRAAAVQTGRDGAR